MNINKFSLTLLWRITGIAVLVLLAATLFLAGKARSQADSGFTGQISGFSSTVYLRRQPDVNGRIVSILESGTTVYVDNSRTENGTIWYHIETENESGWIPEENLAIP